MDIRLDGTTALVTGSTSGIGAAIADALADAGAFVIVSGRDSVRGAAVVGGIEARGGSGAFVRSDLSTGEAAHRLAAEAAHAAGGEIDILVNNAARLSTPGPTSGVEEIEILDSLAVNVVAPFLLTGVLAPRMAARGDGAIVNVGSINGLSGFAGSALYSMTKSALHSLTKSWAAEFAAGGVRINAVAPGPTRVAWTEQIADRLDAILERVPDGRLGEPAEVADAVVFLASAHARHIHGATLSIDGGYSAV